MRRLIAAALVGLAVLGPRPTAACSCVRDESTGAELLGKHDAMFIGEFVVIRLIEHHDPRAPRGFGMSHEQEIKFRTWKASSSRTMGRPVGSRPTDVREPPWSPASGSLA
jgi:hypothetical protein